MNDDETPALPKYRQPGFMRKQLALYDRACFQLRQVRRYGENDDPVRAIAPVAPVRSLQPIRLDNRRDADL